MKGLKQQIRKLYLEGNSYRDIEKLLNCSRSLISYHCSDLVRINEIYSSDNIKKYQRYYDEIKSIAATARYFGINKDTLHKYLFKYKSTEEERYIKRLKNRNSYRQQVKEKAVNYKGGKCVICGYNKYTGALEFHHINPQEKDFIISGGTKSFESIKDELGKCILVCSNCHKEIHGDLHPELHPRPDTA